MNEMPGNLSDEEKEAWEKSLTAGSLPTWWKPGDPPPASQAPPPASAAPFPAAATPPPAAAAPPPIAATPAAPAAAPPVAAAPPFPLAPPAPPSGGAWTPPPAAPAPTPPRHSETLHLERSPREAAPPPAPPAPGPAADPYQRTMVMGTFPAAPKTASVMVRSGPDTGAKFALETSPLYVGRAPDNGIVVNDPATSRRHARFELRGQDFLIVDLGSANGTLVDGVRVVEKVLAGGAVITMGQNEFVVSIS